MHQIRQYQKSILVLFIAYIGTFSIIPVRLAIAKHQASAPQAILVLEGRTERIRFAAQFSKTHPDLPIWVSGNPDGLRLNQSIFRQSGIGDSQVYYDFCAVDTVTNFTCNVRAFKSRNIQHVYVITSDYHMARSLAIATFVFGSHGIAVTPVSVVSQDHRTASPLRIARDCLRSLVWIFTGHTGAILHYFLE